MKAYKIKDNQSIQDIADKMGEPLITIRHLLDGAIDKIFVCLLRKFSVEEIYEMFQNYRDRNSEIECSDKNF